MKKRERTERWKNKGWRDTREERKKESGWRERNSRKIVKDEIMKGVAKKERTKKAKQIKKKWKKRKDTTWERKKGKTKGKDGKVKNKGHSANVGIIKENKD